MNESSECTLANASAGTAAPRCVPQTAFIATLGTEFGDSSSTLSGTVNSTKNGTLIEFDCFGPELNKSIGNSDENITNQPLGQTTTKSPNLLNMQYSET